MSDYNPAGNLLQSGNRPRRSVLPAMFAMFLLLALVVALPALVRAQPSPAPTIDRNPVLNSSIEPGGYQGIAVPVSLDDDGDGLSNSQELWWCSDPLDADTDGDGAEDGAELASGTDPLDPASRSSLRINIIEETFCDNVTEITRLECEALVAFYNSTDGPNWTDNSGWLDTYTPCTDWRGLTCAGGHVTDIQLRNNHLNGTLPPQLGDLTYLESLSLIVNQIGGSIPPELGELTTLQTIYLSDNQLSGAIPPELGSLPSLINLYLATNQITGTIPAELGSLPSLEYLTLNENRLEGGIPAELGDLSNLIMLRLQNNALLGEIPPAISNLTNLSSTDWGYNGLMASDPALIAFLNSKDPDWADTQTVPPTDLAVVTVMSHTVELFWEPITYTLDGGFYQVSSATAPGGPYVVQAETRDKRAPGITVEGLSPDTTYYFVVRTHTPAHGDQQNDLWSEYSQEVSATTLSEPISGLSAANDSPTALGLTTTLTATITGGTGITYTWFFGDGHMGSGRVVTHPYAYAGLHTTVVTASNSAGYLTATTPVSITGDTFCDYVGQIPRSECEALITFYNSTGGDDWTDNSGWLDTYTPCTDWKGLTCAGGHVTDINLRDNNLGGTLPLELRDFTYLESLSVVVNQIGGSIPPELGELGHLQTLYLASNQLSDTIPPELGNLQSLTSIHLFTNQLTGTIPAELGNLSNLEYIRLFDNQLSGSIPAELGDLAKLRWLYLHSNQLNGAIPPDLGNLQNLTDLHVAGNRLTGTIPAELGNLSNLEYLHLENNVLMGEIPPAIANLTNLYADERLTDFGYNGLMASDPVVMAFLNSKDPDWADTQTVPPTNLAVVSAMSHTVELSWEPITYTLDGGFYQVSSANTPGGPYVAWAESGDKTATGLALEGLSPDTTYYFVVRTHTPAHGDQQNDLWSDYSQEVSATTATEPIWGLSAANDGPTPLGTTTTLTAALTSGSSVTYTWDFGDGEMGSGALVTHTYAAVGDYTAVVTASNSLGQSTVTTLVTILAPELALLPDWNLVSWPLTPQSTSLVDILDPMGGACDEAWAYDAWDDTDPWKQWPGDLSEVDETMGLWLHLTVTSTLPVTGHLPVSSTIELQAGLNLVGYPSPVARPVAEVLAPIADKLDRALTFEATDALDPWKMYDVDLPPYANDLDMMEPGRGYWIYATAPCTLTVEP